jgi:dolichol-phosphate mannosyltransferase
MFHNRRVAVVVPCYNVAAHVVSVISTLPDLVDHVVVVDDGSTDDCAAAVASVASPRVVLVRHATNLGLARAMESGFARAVACGADVVVKMDGDGQMDPAELPRLLQPIVAGTADLTKGNRFLRRRHLAGMPAVRLLGNVGLSFLTKAASGYWNIFDPTNGYVAIRREVLEEIDMHRLGPRYFFESSLLCEAYLTGAVVRDVSVPARYNGEKSSLSIHRTTAAFPFLLLRAAVRRIAIQHFIRDFTPVALFLVTGLVLMALGFAYGWNAWALNAAAHQQTAPGTVAIMAIPLVAGAQLILQAIVLDIGSVPTRSPWDDPQ